MNVLYTVAPNKLRAGSVFSLLCDVAPLLPEFSHTICVNESIEKCYSLDLDQVAAASGLDLLYQPLANADNTVNVAVFPVGCTDQVSFARNSDCLTVTNAPNVKQWQAETYMPKSKHNVFSLLSGPTNYDKEFTLHTLEFLLAYDKNCVVKINTYDADSIRKLPPRDTDAIQMIPLMPGIKRQMLGDVTLAIVPQRGWRTRMMNELAAMKIPVVQHNGHSFSKLKVKLDSLLYSYTTRQKVVEEQYRAVLKSDLKYNITAIREYLTKLSCT